MRPPTPFFLPYASDSRLAEDQYQAFASWCSRRVPDLGKRVQCIEWVSNGEDWVAEVG